MLILVLTLLLMSFNGGIRKRLHLSREPDNQARVRGEDDGTVEAFAIEQVKKGKFSAKECQNLLSRDGSSNLSNIGALGSNPKNTGRDLTRKPNKTTPMPPRYEGKMWFWGHNLCERYESNVHFMIPYEVDDAIGETAWADIPITSPIHRRRADWCPKYGIDPADVLPVGLWGDLAPCSNNESLFLMLRKPITVLCTSLFQSRASANVAALESTHSTLYGRSLRGCSKIGPLVRTQSCGTTNCHSRSQSAKVMRGAPFKAPHASAGDCSMQGWSIKPLARILGMKPEYIDIDLMHAGCLGILPMTLGNIPWEWFVRVGGVFTRPGEALGQLTIMIKLAACHLDDV